jgi:hypothetical protein
MVLIAGIFGHLLLTLFEQEPATKATTAVPAGLSTNQQDTNTVNDMQVVSAQQSFDAMMDYGTGGQQVIL